MFGKVRARLVWYYKSYRIYQIVGYGYGCRTGLAQVSGMEVVPNLPKCRVRVQVWMLYEAYQSVGYGTAACTHTRTRTRPLVFQQGRARCQSILPRAYPTYQTVGYGYGCRTKFTKGSGTGRGVYQDYQRVVYGYRCGTKLTKGSGTGMDVLPSLPKGRVWYGCLYPYPYSTPVISTEPYPVPGYFPAGVPNLPENRVRVWKSHQAYQSVGYG